MKPSHLFFTCAISLISTAAPSEAQPPVLTESTGPQLSRAHTVLKSALSTLDRTPGHRKALSSAVKAIAQLQEGLDAYFHDPELTTAARRPPALKARGAVLALLSPQGGLFTVQLDQVTLQSAPLDTLLRGALRQKRSKLAARFLEQKLVVDGPSEDTLTQLAGLYRTLGQRRSAEAARLALADLRSQLEDGQPAVDDPKPTP
ncbi:MAG: hypothetical protein ACE366_05895 [Bradymonadia bacterium]